MEHEFWWWVNATVHTLISKIKIEFSQSLGSGPQIGRNYQTVSSKLLLFIFIFNKTKITLKISKDMFVTNNKDKKLHILIDLQGIVSKNKTQ